MKNVAGVVILGLAALAVALPDPYFPDGVHKRVYYESGRRDIGERAPIIEPSAPGIIGKRVPIIEPSAPGIIGKRAPAATPVLKQRDEAEAIEERNYSYTLKKRAPAPTPVLKKRDEAEAMEERDEAYIAKERRYGNSYFPPPQRRQPMTDTPL